MLGWKLAWLNASEIAGKRGLIQRAVDSYRNRYPSMRSRRVARQEKLLNGTLRKRKHREGIFDDTCTELEALSKVSKTTSQESKYMPKTISIDDGPHGTKCRIRINIESVPLEAIDMPFRQSNCVFPRAMNITPSTPSVTQRQLDEAACNELGWKLVCPLSHTFFLYVCKCFHDNHSNYVFGNLGMVESSATCKSKELTATCARHLSHQIRSTLETSQVLYAYATRSLCTTTANNNRQ